ncbi:MAG: GntR family transcriptional regulator [Candidatus Omnitrophota bacterium]
MDKNIKLYFQINPSSGVPIYRQIIDQVKLGIATGKFKPGEYLPSVREVSTSLEINPMTVSKAYSLLEKSGVIELVRGQGMRIPEASKDDSINHEQQLVPILRETVNAAKQLSLDMDTVIKKLKDIWEGNSHE